MLTENKYIAQPKCYALLSLMCMLAARFDSRLSPEGEIILLAEQDRSIWSKELIDIGLDYLNRSSAGDEITDYHIEAAIAAEHCIAPKFSDTNWKRILVLYDMLKNVNASPVVLLNRAIVIGKIDGAKKALEEIKKIPELEKYLKSNYLFSAVLGEVYFQLNDFQQAQIHFESALKLTKSDAEKKLIEKKIKRLSRY